MKDGRELLTNLDQGVLVLTVNRRLAQHLQDKYAKLQTEPVWQSPSILPLQTWISQTWQMHQNHSRVLLTDFQESHLWQKIIRDYANEHPIIQIHNTAQLAKQAWQLMHYWQLSLDDLFRQANDETATFIEWLRSFQKSLDENQWITTAELVAAEAPKPDGINKILLVGFDDISPAIQSRLDSYIKNGIEVEFTDPMNPSSQTNRIAIDTKEEELLIMARWAQAKIKQHPEQTVLCLVPNLTQIRDQVETVFNKVCTSPFNLSAGRALSDYPVIQAALCLFELNLNDIDFTMLSSTLMSLYHNDNAADRCCAAKVESELRLYPSMRLKSDNILHECQRQAQKFDGSTLGERWQTYTSLKSTASEKTLYPSEWIEPLQNLLLGIGWPSTRPLNSETFQVVQRWQNLWAEFAALDDISGSLSYYCAIHLLKQLAQQTVFQRKGTPSQIHIMGLLESSGLYFDNVWLMGLDDETWPPKAKPNPFIPYQLQRDHKMPHSSSERELAYCQALQNRLNNSCNVFNISYATQDGDKSLSPSRLIKAAEELIVNKLELEDYTSTAEKQLEMNAIVEKIEDEKGPILQPEEITYGGSWILQQQALCPFRSFAKIRLHAESPGETTLGLDAAQRGTLTHAALENIWKAIKDQKTLLAFKPDELSELVREKINEAVKLSDGLEANFIHVEKQRLHELLLAWLELEKTRPNFSVREQETDRFVQVGDLKLRIKIDRIDELDNNTHFVIDYKTGKSNPLSHWFNESLTQPQLPLYCLYGTDHAAGICYAQVNMANMQFSGIISEGAESLAFSKIKTTNKADPLKRSWHDLKTEWGGTLEKLSHDFCNGIAQIKPSVQACLYCDLHSFCRVGMNDE